MVDAGANEGKGSPKQPAGDPLAGCGEEDTDMVLDSERTLVLETQEVEESQDDTAGDAPLVIEEFHDPRQFAETCCIIDGKVTVTLGGIF